MYKTPKYKRSTIKSVDLVEGETIEMKIERILEIGEPIKDGAPEIFTERSQGVLAGYNIRTDRWEVAVEAMDYVSRSKQAKRDELSKKTDEEAAAIKESGKTGEIGKTESTQGKDGGK